MALRWLLILSFGLSLVLGCQPTGAPNAPTVTGSGQSATGAQTAIASPPARPAGRPAASPAVTPAVSPAARAAAAPDRPELLLATTTSTYDSGLLDVLLPDFEARTGYRVKPVSVGSGQAIVLGERGEVDVLLVHSPAAEDKFLAEGHGLNRQRVMYNDFVLVGPPSDPAGVKNSESANAALQRIADANAPFISRGDNSGTHALEKQLWQQAGFSPAGQSWYQEVGQGMGQTLNIAQEKQAYTLTDRGTFLSRQQTPNQTIVFEGDRSLFNVYHVVQVNPDRHAHVNSAGAQTFVEYLTGAPAQQLIEAFGREKYGQPLFVPDAQPSPAAR